MKAALLARPGALQGLYNPDRITDPWPAGERRVAEAVVDDAIGRLAGKVKEGARPGSRIPHRAESGSFGELVDAWMKEVSGRHVTHRVVRFEACGRATAAPRYRRDPLYDFARARYIVSFGADFMETGSRRSATRTASRTRTASTAIATVDGEIRVRRPRLSLTG